MTRLRFACTRPSEPSIELVLTYAAQIIAALPNEEINGCRRDIFRISNAERGIAVNRIIQRNCLTNRQRRRRLRIEHVIAAWPRGDLKRIGNCSNDFRTRAGAEIGPLPFRRLIERRSGGLPIAPATGRQYNRESEKDKSHFTSRLHLRLDLPATSWRRILAPNFDHEVTRDDRDRRA